MIRAYIFGLAELVVIACSLCTVALVKADLEERKAA